MHYQQNFDGLRINSVVVPTNRKRLVEKCIEKYIAALQQSLAQVQWSWTYEPMQAFGT